VLERPLKTYYSKGPLVRMQENVFMNLQKYFSKEELWFLV